MIADLKRHDDGAGRRVDEEPVVCAPVSASRPRRSTSAEFTFHRPDWTLFRSLASLSHKAGVRTEPTASWRQATADIAAGLLAMQDGDQEHSR